MKIAIRRCHQRTGSDGCASDIVNEIEVAEAYYRYVIEGLKSLGHDVLDVTPPEAYRSLSDSLMYGVNKANAWGADYFISCHANDFKRTNSAMGCEVIYFGNSSKGRELAVSIDKKIVDLGFKNRGAKADDRGLCELRNTNAVAVIIEPFFVCSYEDVRVWNEVGAKKLGYAIAEGITKQSIDTDVGNKPSNGYDYSCKGKYGVVNGTDVRLRDGASTDSKILGYANKGEKFEIGYKLGDWYSVYWGDHGAFISASYLQIVETSSNGGSDWIRRLQTECNRQGFSNQAVDGFAGPNTLDGCPMLKPNARGNITYLLQEKLNQLGYGTNGIDGIFGNGTRQAVIQFQQDNGLGADGIVGRNTWRVLLGL